MHVGLGDAISDLKVEIIAQRAAVKAATTPQAKATALSALLSRIGALASQYRTQGNEALVSRWMTEYRAIQAASAQAQALAKEQGPGAVMRALDAVSDRAFKLADTVVRGVEGVASGLGTTARLLPILLPLAVVAAAFVIGGGGLGGVLRARRR